MLRSQQHTATLQRAHAQHLPASRGVLVFSVGGYTMAARMEDIVEVHSWQKPIMVPSDTPWVTGMVRLEQECLPVYDLAAKLQRAIDESAALCLVVKHEDGPMAVCIDATIPSLHMVNIQNMRPVDDGDHDLLGRCMVAGQEVTVLRAAQLGKIPSDAMASRRQRSG